MQEGADAAEPPADEAGAACEPAYASAEEPDTSGRPEVQFAPGVLAKLLAFSLLLAALPLSLLFATRNGYLDALLSAFVGRLTPDTRLFAGAVVAVIAVNVVVAAYIVSAFKEKPGPALKED